MEDQKNQIAWRDDPSESFSDWKIEIVASPPPEGQELAASQVYHIHRCILVYGPRRSDYFARVLRSSFQETQKGACRIELHPLAAKLFPVFLDFLYGLDPLPLETKIATPLLHLAEYFQVQHLQSTTTDFIRKELGWIRVPNAGNRCTCTIYKDHAQIFQVPWVQEKAQEVLDELVKRDMDRHIKLLEHASKCDGISCVSENCATMKEYFQHHRTCQHRQTLGSCTFCDRMWTLEGTHVERGCNQSNCPVPNCNFIRRNKNQMILDGRWPSTVP